ncbi:predicted protein [Plenodomus lingam JN3]|uniref:Predicted protein n=1 Tax=Leptosphaeria maculans (strain JN3 / isolate v23.1.3 / race Av1-4-5-6-7-8) TaxID=985895 RepID=E5A285_LEPMJ|nr:predicted protein [Plenodomus lingam JN3]CBX97962.1 predicted protein [Plenodomus lingam JN3]
MSFTGTGGDVRYLSRGPAAWQNDVARANHAPSAFVAALQLNHTSNTM